MMKENKLKAIAYIDELAPVLEAVSDAIWEKPELSMSEQFAAETYCRALAEQGFEVEEKICGIDTAFCGSFGSGKPVIGILAEYDSLSGLSQKAGLDCEDPIVPGGNGHGCGHNLLGAGSFAAAVAVKKYLEDTGCPGTVKLFGCPGEEGCSGKAYMAREKLWYGLDAALCWHPGDTNEITSGTNNSCVQVLYKFTGIAAHAAGDPFNGRSALDAVELMNVGVQFLREHTTPDCRIHYSIIDAGGVSPNVVQSKASVLYMVRANKVADSVKLLKRVDKIAAGAAMMTETEYERQFVDGTAELLPNYTIEKALYENFVEIGVPAYSDEDYKFAAKLKKTYPASKISGKGTKFDEEIAKQVRELTENMTKPINDFVMPLYSGTYFIPGSTDVGDVSWQTPTAQITAATWPSGVPGHSWQIVACGKTHMAHSAMLCAGKVLAATAIDLLTDSELLAKAKAEFAERSADGYVCPIEEDAIPCPLF